MQYGFLWKKDYFNSPLILFYLQTFSVNIHITNPDFFLSFANWCIARD